MRLPLSILIILFISFSCKKIECSQDSNCSSFGPPSGITCQMYVEGYYYDSNENKCLYYSGSACGAPPFEKESDCTPCECKE